MHDDEKKYLSTTEVAQQLDLSVGTVQKLVNTGVLQAIVTRGGHRRIFIESVEGYKNTNGYRKTNQSQKVCIMHQGNDLDPFLVKPNKLDDIQLMSNPLDLLSMEQDVGALFIDARNSWLQTTPKALIDGLRKKYSVVIYSTDSLPKSSHFFQIEGIHLLREAITSHFISGYRVAKSMGQPKTIPA